MLLYQVFPSKQITVWYLVSLQSSFLKFHNKEVLKRSALLISSLAHFFCLQSNLLILNVWQSITLRRACTTGCTRVPMWPRSRGQPVVCLSGREYVISITYRHCVFPHHTPAATSHYQLIQHGQKWPRKRWRERIRILWFGTHPKASPSSHCISKMTESAMKENPLRSVGSVLIDTFALRYSSSISIY